MAEKQTAPSVLLVIQDPAILVLVASMLEQNGFRALYARNRDEAVEVAARQYVPIDVAVCDIRVAGDSGEQIMSRVRDLRPGIRELFLSTMVDHGAIRIKVVRQGSQGEIESADRSNLIDCLKTALAPVRKAAGG